MPLAALHPCSFRIPVIMIYSFADDTDVFCTVENMKHLSDVTTTKLSKLNLWFN